jgi:tripartite-type tricarboxylate transporter receptor subunit TctC
LARLLLSLLAVALLGVAAEVPAQSYPTRPIRLIVGFAAGGVADVTARVVAQQLGEQLGQSVVVDNRPGAGAMVAAEAVAKAAPDGYTLLLMTNGNAISASQVCALPYDTLADFVPISTLGFLDVAIVAGSQSRIEPMAVLLAHWTTFVPRTSVFALGAALRAHAKANPRQARHRHDQRREHAAPRSRAI